MKVGIFTPKPKESHCQSTSPDIPPPPIPPGETISSLSALISTHHIVTHCFKRCSGNQTAQLFNGLLDWTCWFTRCCLWDRSKSSGGFTASCSKCVLLKPLTFLSDHFLFPSCWKCLLTGTNHRVSVRASVTFNRAVTPPSGSSNPRESLPAEQGASTSRGGSSPPSWSWRPEGYNRWADRTAGWPPAQTPSRRSTARPLSSSPAASCGEQTHTQGHNQEWGFEYWVVISCYNPT